MACIQKDVEVDIELDESDIRELVSDEGLTISDLFSDREIREAAEESADWLHWLERALDEVEPEVVADRLAAIGYVKADSVDMAAREKAIRESVKAEIIAKLFA